MMMLMRMMMRRRSMKVKVKIPVGSVKASLLPRSFCSATRLKTIWFELLIQKYLLTSRLNTILIIIHSVPVLP